MLREEEEEESSHYFPVTISTIGFVLYKFAP
jgi:hypothetical protein